MFEDLTTHTGKNLDEFKKGLKTDISYFTGEQN